MSETQTYIKPVKYDYQDLIKEMETISGYSYFKTRTMLKDLSKLLQQSIKKGIPIETEGLFKIYFTSNRQNNIYLGTCYDVYAQAKDLSQIKQINYNEVLSFIKNYYSTIKTKIEQGYQVNIKGVCYIKPLEDSQGNIFLHTRMSPQLEKPQIAEFVVFKPDGRVVSINIEKRDLRLATYVLEDLKIPHRVVTDNQTTSEFIDLKEV